MGRQIGSGEGKPTERNKLRPHHHTINLRKAFLYRIRGEKQPPEVIQRLSRCSKIGNKYLIES